MKKDLLISDVKKCRKFMKKLGLEDIELSFFFCILLRKVAGGSMCNKLALYSMEDKALVLASRYDIELKDSLVIVKKFGNKDILKKKHYLKFKLFIEILGGDL